MNITLDKERIAMILFSRKNILDEPMTYDNLTSCRKLAEEICKRSNHIIKVDGDYLALQPKDKE